MAEHGIAVVGAGIIGCLVAREIAARAPGTAVTVLDRDAVAAGASRRSAGLFLPKGGTERTKRMASYSHGYYADLRRSHPGLPLYPVGVTAVAGPGDGDEVIGRYLPLATPDPAITTPAGSVTLPAGPNGALTLPAGPNGALTLPAGPNGALTLPAGPNGALTLPAGARAWRIHGGHYCDVPRLAQELAALLRHQVTFAEGIAVTGLVPGDGADGDRSITVECGTGGRLTAGAVVLTPGPWLGAPAWRDLIAPLRLRVKRIAALHIPLPPGPGDEVIMFDSDDAFLLPLAHRGQWLFSYHCPEWDVDPDRLATGLTAAHLSEAQGLLRRFSPVLASACVGGRTFCDAYSPGGEPIVAPLDAAGRIVFAGAAGGSGYRLGPAIAAEAADLLAHLSEGVKRRSHQ
jgi:glycine/D-amino acid oxidase-like deaminating enzyme